MACKIILKDEVKIVRLKDLIPDTRKKIEKELKSLLMHNAPIISWVDGTVAPTLQ